METKPDWLERFVGLNTEAEVIEALMNEHGDIIEQLHAMVEMIASRGLPLGFFNNLLLGAVVGALLEAGMTADEVHRTTTEIVADVIANYQRRARA